MTVPRRLFASAASLAAGVVSMAASTPVWASPTTAPRHGGTIVVAMTPGVAPNGFLPVYSTATFTNINIQLSALEVVPGFLDFH